MTDDLRSLRDNWDGYDGRAITTEACDAAEAVLALCRCAVAVPCAHGGVQVEAHAAGWEVELEIGASGGLLSLTVERCPPPLLPEEAADDDA